MRSGTCVPGASGKPGLGMQVLWRPNAAVSVLSNNYYGYDWLGLPKRSRVHTDNSVQWKYLDRPGAAVRRAAFSLTADAGCESGSGVSCGGGSAGPAQYFVGVMLYNRVWLKSDQVAFTLGGGAMSNPGRYLVLMPPINGATAFSGTPYFTSNPGDQFTAVDASLGVDVMPDEFVTVRAELDHRHSSVPYFAGRGGVTPPGGNTGAPGSAVARWAPDLRARLALNFALLVKL